MNSSGAEVKESAMLPASLLLKTEVVGEQEVENATCILKSMNHCPLDAKDALGEEQFAVRSAAHGPHPLPVPVSLDSGSSVLRSLLQASGKQLHQYQSIRRKRGTTKEDGSGTEEEGRGGGTSGCSFPGRRSPTTTSTRKRKGVVLLGGGSEVTKALLLGHAYERTPIPLPHGNDHDASAQGSKRKAEAVDMEEAPWSSRKEEGGVCPGKPWRKRRRRRRRKRTPEVTIDRVQHHSSLSPFLSDAIDVIAEYEDLVYSIQRDPFGVCWLDVVRDGLFNVPSLGQSPARVTVDEFGHAHFLVFDFPGERSGLRRRNPSFSILCREGSPPEDVVDEDAASDEADEEGIAGLDANLLRPLLLGLSSKGSHVFCPGSEHQGAASYSSSSSSWTSVDKERPSRGRIERRVRADDCPVWYEAHGHQRAFCTSGSSSSSEEEDDLWEGGGGGGGRRSSGVHRCASCRKIRKKNARDSCANSVPERDGGETNASGQH